MSPCIEVLKPGLFTTIQDLGRHGYQKFGVSVAGAMDFFSHRVANGLVGNPPQAATLECTILGPSLRFLVESTIAMTGADLSPQLDGNPIPMWESLDVQEGSILTFGECRRGCRAYIAIWGGIDVPRVLGSRSTHTRSLLGGLEGRALKKGDRLAVAHSNAAAGSQRFRSDLIERILTSGTLRFLEGPQQNFFKADSLAGFAKGTYRVSNNSDRMGIRFDGPKLIHRGRADIVSEAVPFGSIQVPANGLPIVLAADRQTAGGYPKIGVVITADFPVLAQLKPGDEVQFVPVRKDSAMKALRSLEDEISDRFIPLE
jgi:antagonist of KipI